MPQTYKITPVEELPGRRQNASGTNIYSQALDDVLRSDARYVRLEVPGRKPASIVAGLKQAIDRNQRRYGRLSIRQRGGQVFVERSEGRGQRGRRAAQSQGSERRDRSAQRKAA